MDREGVYVVEGIKVDETILKCSLFRVVVAKVLLPYFSGLGRNYWAAKWPVSEDDKLYLKLRDSCAIYSLSDV